MQTDREHSGSPSFWLQQATNSRPKLPGLLTSRSDAVDIKTPESNGGYESTSDLLDVRGAWPHGLASSAPDPVDPSLAASPGPFSPYTLDETPEADLSMSPAAMFLSSFSPSASVAPLPDAEGEVVAGYTLGPIVGHGGFSIIRRAYSLQGGTVAVKIVRHTDLSKQADPAGAKKRLDHEATVWVSLSHEHILPLFSSSRTPYADFFVTLYCPADSLLDIVKRGGQPGLERDEARRLFQQVVRGLRYLHEAAGLVHGDMKLENVLVDEMGVCRITDFGMTRRIGECDEDDGRDGRDDEDAQAHRVRSSKSLSSHRSFGRNSAIPAHLSLMRRNPAPRHRGSSPFPATAATPAPVLPIPGFQAGSLPYASPELLLPHTPSAPYLPHPAQDIWALGVMLYALLTGRLPFSDAYEPRLQMKILHGAYDAPAGIGAAAAQILAHCIERCVPKRWTIAQVDDVAWRIGCDDPDELGVPEDRSPSRLSSRSRSRAQDSVAVDDEESHYSSRRAARSGSRSASALRSSSSGRSPSAMPRSTSRGAHPYEDARQHHAQAHPAPRPPTLSGLTHAIMRTGSVSSSVSSASNAHDAALLLTPSERGRRPRRAEDGSVSPLRELMSPAKAELADHDAVVDEELPWSPPSAGHGRAPSLGRRRSPLETRVARAGSVPPGSTWPAKLYSNPSMPGLSAGTTPRPIPGRGLSARSRSVDVHGGQKARQPWWQES